MRRPNGSGTVVKLSGNRRRPYAVRVPGRDKYGQIIQRTLSYHEKQREALDALDEYNRNLAAGTAPAPDKLSITVQEVYDAWSAREYKKLLADGSKASVVSHKAAWNKRVSRFAARKFREVTLDEWQSILDQDEDDGLSQSTINNDAILIKALYKYAMERDIVGKDYSQYLEVPSVDPKRAKGAFTDLQLARLEQMAKDGVPWADTVLILSYTGFRIRELLMLTPFSYHHENGGYLQSGVKTEAGKDRIVPIHPKIAPYVKRRLSEGHNTIIAAPNGEKVSYGVYFAAFKKIANELEAPDATPHWCRHTFATRLHSAGVDRLVRKWLMGHSTKGDVTDGYTHKTISILVDAVQKLA